MKVLMEDSFGWTICGVREARVQKNTWGQDVTVLVGDALHDKLEHLHFWRSREDVKEILGDAPNCGSFSGHYNTCREISDEQERLLRELDCRLRAEDELKARDARRKSLASIVEKFDKQKRKPETAEEARHLMREWNDLHNEGGEGFVPRIYSKSERDRAAAELAAMGGGEA